MVHGELTPSCRLWYDPHSLTCGEMYPQLIFIAVLGAALLGSAASISFSYGDQAAWADLTGSFCGGTSQSPIDILTSDVSTDRVLPALQFSGGWTASRSGRTQNTGHSAQFIPAVTDTVTSTPVGDYRLQQFHFHWGRNDGEGSEHTVDGLRYSGELHFVHRLESEEHYTAVIAVLLEADSGLPIAGSPWENFIVPKNYTARAIDVTDIVYSDFLPEGRGYYHYQGSLTTPLCNETVEWFVMKQHIDVPAEYLAELRELEVDPEDGEGHVTYNFRDTQPLNGRVVVTGGARAISALSLSLLLLASAFSVMA